MNIPIITPILTSTIEATDIKTITFQISRRRYSLVSFS